MLTFSLKLVDLRKDPVDAADLLGSSSAGNALGGIFGAVLGETPADTQARVEEAKKTATDLTGLVRKKKQPTDAESPAPATDSATNGKRKAGDEDQGAVEDGGAPASPKKVKVDSAE